MLLVPIPLDAYAWNSPPLKVSLLAIIERMWLNLSEVIHAWNFWFYVSRMAIFRSELFALLHLTSLEHLCQSSSARS